MKGTQNHLSHKYISSTEVGIKIEATFMVGLEIMHRGETHCTIKILEVETEVTLPIEEITDITCEVVRDIGTNYNDYRRNNYRGQGYNRNRSRSLDRQDRGRKRDRSASNGRSRSRSRASTNRDRIRCFEYREYDHFARGCPTR